MSTVDQGDDEKLAEPLANLDRLDEALLRGGEHLAEVLRTLQPADIGLDLSRHSVEDGKRVLEASEPRRAAAILRSADPETAARLLGPCLPLQASAILGFLPTEHRVAIFGHLDDEARAQIERTLDGGERAELERLRQYPESAVARMMTSKIWRAYKGHTAGDAMAILRSQINLIEVAQNCHVVDGERLVGVCPLRELAVAEPSTPLERIMMPGPIAVLEDSPRAHAARIVRRYDFLSLPVVTRDGVLVGAVRVDDLLHAALDKVGAGQLNQGAVQSSIVARIPYFQTSIRRVVRSRLTWLVLLFVAETATGTVLRYFEDELARVVALSFFIPLLIGTGGNAGSQTVSTVIRALAVGEVRVRDVWRVVFREVSAGLLLGILLGAIAFGRALLWGVHADLAACVAVTVLVVCTWANAVGATIPLVAQRVGIDPTVVSAPLITTLVDASGLFIYFSVAHVMVAQLH